MKTENEKFKGMFWFDENACLIAHNWEIYRVRFNQVSAEADWLFDFGSDMFFEALSAGIADLEGGARNED